MSELSVNDSDTSSSSHLLQTPNIGALSNSNTSASGGAQPGASPATQAAALVAADPAQFIPYMRQLVVVLLDVANPNDFDKCLNDKSSMECVRKFISDAQTRNLIVQKYHTKDEEESEQTLAADDSISTSSNVTQFLISNEIHYTNPKCIRY